MQESAANHESDPGQPRSISSSLLERARVFEPEAWRRLVKLYGPEVYRWCRVSGLRPEDAADMVQEVFSAIATHIRDFRRDRPEDTFCGWLWTIARNKISDHYRGRQGEAEARGGTTAQRFLAQIPGQPPRVSHADQPSGREGNLALRALELIRAGFEERTWEAFWLTTVEGMKAGEVADKLGMSLDAVYQAKSRVLRRIREELGELIE